MRGQPITKPLSKLEKFICEMIWGSIPTDVEYVRNSNMFKKGIELEKLGIWNNYKSI